MEAKIAGRAGRLTPGGLRSALARAVLEAAPETARERRKTAARFARVERWAEDSGNAALMGRELPPDEVLACDQRICWSAGELNKAGLEGGMDELRARALPGPGARERLPAPPGRHGGPAARDSTGSSGNSAATRTAATAPPARAGDSAGTSSVGNSGGTAQQPPGAGPARPRGRRGGGFAGRVTLTVPLGAGPALRTGPGSWAGTDRSTLGSPATSWTPPRLTRRQPGA